MTADIRTAAQREAMRLRVTSNGREYGMAKLYKDAFVDGAVWCAARITPTREQVEKVLTDHEIGDGGTPHSWRCEYPDRYPGYCSCVKDIAGDLLALLAGLAEGERIEPCQ